MQVVTSASAAQAPGCFGAASVYALDSKVCKQCPAYEACGQKAHEVLVRIKGRINVQDFLKLHEKARLAAGLPKQGEAQVAPAPVAQPQPVTAPVVRATPVEQVKYEVSAQDRATIERMGNVKVKAVAESLARNNQLGFIRQCLRAQKNPFTDARHYPNMRVAVDMLLQGGFTKASLAMRYVQELSWTEGTAASQRAAAVCMLQALGVVREANGVFMLEMQ